MREILVKGVTEQKHKTELNMNTCEPGPAIILINTFFILLEHIFSHFTSFIPLPYSCDSFLCPRFIFLLPFIYNHQNISSVH